MDIRRFSGSLSLKARFALAAGALVLLVAAVLTSAAVMIAQRGIDDVIRARESALITQLAGELDRKILLRQQALLRLASDLSQGTQNAADFQGRLEQYHALDGLFSNMSLVDARGDLVANLDNPEARGKVNLSHRAHFIDTMRTGAPVISRPVRGKVTPAPLVAMTAPIRAADGRIAYLLIGLIDLGRDGFLHDLAQGYTGKGSSYYLMSGEGVFIAHPDDGRLLQQVDEARGDNPALRGALSGDALTVRGRGAGGREELVSSHRLESTGWIVAAAYPTAVAAAFADKVRLNAAILALVLVVVIAPVVWLVIDHQLLPLTRLGERMRAPVWQPAASYGADELGELSHSFDQLMAERQRAEQAVTDSERHLRLVANNVPALVAYVDKNRRFVFGNVRYEQIFGVPANQLRGMPVRAVVGEAIYAASEQYVEAALRGETVRFERPTIRAGRQEWDRVAYNPDFDEHGQVRGYFALVDDITHHKTTEMALMTQQRLLRSVADNLPALVNSIDTGGRIRFANRQHEAWVGRPLAQIEGAQIESLLSAEELAAHQHYFDKAMQGERSRWGFQRTLRGEERHFQADYIPQTEGDKAVGVTCLVNDVTETKLVEQQLSALARFDALTGLPNRTHLVERIGRAIARSGRSGSSIGLMYLDLDKFKSINDSFGHGGGDLVLKEFGRRLSACVRQSDTVGRLAGDEFVILLEGLQGESECQLVAAKIIRAMERPFDIDGVARIVTTSLGVATCVSGAAASVDTLLKHADDALYRAKEKGRNRYAITAVI